ncbi:tripartite tricarboxylate transporter permease [Sporomusa malonica]|uniref:Putative tricarboxylic transport membrane protein n=1 Tax=Sporomusa malonica TaxID=112901 RepID=A0A1W1Y9V4_9FIRM|nr:tripartite tricarboxylate transporter permease [Sporomusa malonica]SMC32538.1 putative tricarboxylic transport membrane protein [Sporomusa malonica]
METLSLLLQGFTISIIPANLLACTIGVLIGTLVGVLPGIGTVSTIALLLPFSYSMDSTAALIMFAGIYYGSKFGGSTTSILLNVPGEAASVVTCLDGYPMAQLGRAGAALAVSAIGSFVASTIGVIGLTLFAPPLAQAALAFGPPEYFALALVGLIILTNLTGTSTLKSAMMVVVGIMLGTIGLDSLSGISRFTLGFDEMDRGFELSILAMGMFGIGEILTVMTKTTTPPSLPTIRFRDLYPTREEWRRSVPPMFRGGIVGFLVGLLPGPAATIASFVSYSLEKRCSKNPAEFGHGAIEGVAGPESANNSAISATMIPLLSLGLPFCGATAILLSGFMIHGITPGPALITQQPDLFWGLITSMYIGSVLLLIINLPLIGIFVQLLKTPLNILMPLIALLTLTGAYSINNSMSDLVWIVIFGVVGFFLRRTGFEPGPLLIGVILGPGLEQGLVRGLIICDGNIWSLFTRPLAGSILAVGVLVILYNTTNWFIKDNKRRKEEHC